MDMPEISAELARALSDNQKRVMSSGREIDQQYIRRGFIGIQAELEFIREAFGDASYNALLEAHSSPEAFERFREVDGEMRRQLAMSDKSADELWKMVYSSELLPSATKSEYLSGISRERFESWMSAYVPSLLGARNREEDMICTTCAVPSIPLHEKSTSELRKSTYNEVSADAFGDLGFDAVGRKRGVDSYAKKISPEFIILIEPDVASLERQYSGNRLWQSVYWPLIPFDFTVSLCSAEKKSRRRYASFPPIPNCLAVNKLMSYDDTRSMEVMIRAIALWIQLTVLPLESAIRAGRHG